MYNPPAYYSVKLLQKYYIFRERLHPGDRKKTSEKDQREAEEEDRMLLTENSSIPSASENQAKYMVLLENDTVVVYEIVDWKKYLTTDIAKERLPEDVVEDLRDGMDFSSEKDLFAFLENYSS